MESAKESTKRLEYADNAKGLLMILVVLGHGLNMTLISEGFIHSWINTFHVPAFFMLSGLLFNVKWFDRDLLSFFKRRLITLVLPYLIFDLIGGAVNAFILHIEFPKNIIKNTLTLKCNLIPDWYLPTLFFALTLFVLIGRVDRKTKYKPCTIICGVASLVISLLSFDTSDSMDQTPVLIVTRTCFALFFIILGHYYRYISDYLLARPYYLILAGLITIACVFYNMRVSFWLMNARYPWLFVLSGAAGFYMLIFASKKIHSRILAIIGINSLFILGTHYIIRNMILFSPPYDWPIKWGSFFLYLLYTILFEAALIAGITFLKRSRSRKQA